MNSSPLADLRYDVDVFRIHRHPRGQFVHAHKRRRRQGVPSGRGKYRWKKALSFRNVPCGHELTEEVWPQVLALVPDRAALLKQLDLPAKTNPLMSRYSKGYLP